MPRKLHARLSTPKRQANGVSADGAAVVDRYLSELRELAGSLDAHTLGHIVETISAALIDGRTVFLAGNGGSATAAAHMAVDWTSASAFGGWQASVVNLAESVGRLTAIGNDFHFSEIFSRQLHLTAVEGDLLVLLSVSGSSPNLICAAQAAAAIGMPMIGLLGHAGELTEYCDLWALLGNSDYGLTEDLQVSVNHMVARALRGGVAHVYRPGEDE
jgi:D-sedoheptulose 7-phosphate isomerase